MNEQQKQISINESNTELSSRKISPIKALQLNSQLDSNDNQTEYDQQNTVTQFNQPIFPNSNTISPQKLKNNNNNDSINDSSIQNNTNNTKELNIHSKMLDSNRLRQEFKKMKQNLTKSQRQGGNEDSYYDNESQIDNINSRNERMIELTKFNKSINYSVNTSPNKNQNPQTSPHKSMRESMVEVERKNKIKIEKLKEQKKLEKRQKMIEESLMEDERKNLKEQEQNQQKQIIDQLESNNFYSSVNQILDKANISFENFILVKRVNLLKKNTLEENIIDYLLQKNNHTDINIFKESLFIKLATHLLSQIRCKSYSIFLFEWIWIIVMIIINSMRIYQFQDDQIKKTVEISNEEIISGETIPVLLYIQIFLWILCDIALIVSVTKCRIPFSTFHLMFHIGEIILNIFTFALGITIVYNNINSSALPLHLIIGILDFLFSVISLTISKSLHTILKKFLILMNQYSTHEFQNSCC